MPCGTIGCAVRVGVRVDEEVVVQKIQLKKWGLGVGNELSGSFHVGGYV